ncbi:plasma membrane iron permease [Grosmannia clavigera kw1407]|uniref:Plasma membrane iron permease n=1 Tax=Grosmannia clavigera (strain kw1407 / UAMH 11150) TaxID=655863 RepID=F0XLH4_GROCL|nr:plasma membrane iron permease [Grosmannia clavigera kw1407]EFX01190.1 plasma membrane iron permease [Grosmannia clavigera kw1407]
MGKNVFAVQVFFIVFREVLEAGIILSVLLSFLKQVIRPTQDEALYKRLVRHVWLGAGAGIFCCLCIGGAFIGVFYGLGHDIWSKSEDLWEGIFYIIATVIVTAMGLALLRVNKMRAKWQVKIAQSLINKKSIREGGLRAYFHHFGRRNVMFILPFITTLREGVEAVVFVGGVSLNYPATSFPLPVVTGFIAASLIGYLFYRGGNVMSIQIFLIFCTSVLYLIAAGMFSRAIWSFENYKYVKGVGSDVSEQGSGDGSYNIRQAVWHVNCCNAETDNGWDVFNAILGWENTGTYGSVIGYCCYWLLIIVSVIFLMYEERTGYLPGAKFGLNVAAKIPGLRGWAKKRIFAHEHGIDVDEIVQQVNAEHLA